MYTTFKIPQLVQEAYEVQQGIVESTVESLINVCEAVQQTPDGKHVKLKNVCIDTLRVATGNDTYYDENMLPLAQMQRQAEQGDLDMFMDHTKFNEHPKDGNSLKDAVIYVDKLWWTEVPETGALNVMADLTISNEGYGPQIKERVLLGKAVGISKRGVMGKFVTKTLENGQKVNVPTPYVFYAYDVVYHQSVDTANTNHPAQNHKVVIENKHNSNRSEPMNDQTNPVMPSVDVIMNSTDLVNKLASQPRIIELVGENLRSTLASSTEAAINEARTEIQNDMQTKLDALQPKLDVLESITKAILGANLVNNDPVSERETKLQESLDAKQGELDTANETIAKLNDRIKALEAIVPKPLDKDAMEAFFLKLPSGKAVFETATKEGKEFFTEDDMTAFYQSVQEAARALLGIQATEESGQTKGVAHVTTSVTEQEDDTKPKRRPLADRVPKH